jgi:EamA domain-containing membrane protein RarD
VFEGVNNLVVFEYLSLLILVILGVNLFDDYFLLSSFFGFCLILIALFGYMNVLIRSS